MILEEMTKEVCENSYAKFRERSEKKPDTAYSFEKYWEINKEYFIKRVKIYLEVRDCLGENNIVAKS